MIFNQKDSNSTFRLNNSYADNMVIQYGKTIKIKGTTKNNTNIVVTVSGVNSEGREISPLIKTAVLVKPDMEESKDTLKWIAEFDAFPNAGGAYTITAESGPKGVDGYKRIQIRNITFGDVYLLAGQSNMERQMQGTSDTLWEITENQKEIARANNSNIRIFNMYNIETEGASSPLEEPPYNEWHMMTAEVAYNSSAIGYYFAQEINETRNIPIGLISNAVGGTIINAWSCVKGINDPVEFHLSNDKLEQLGRLYNNRIYPFRDMAIKGILYYQGESDQGLPAKVYAEKMARLINNYRELFHDEALPFYYVQLTRLDTWQGENSQPYDFSEIREGQTLALQMVANKANIGMVSTLDIVGSFDNTTKVLPKATIWTGNARTDIHPCGKKIIAERLSKLVRKGVYREDIITTGPIFQSMRIVKNTIEITFKATGNLKVMPKEQYADWYTDTYIFENNIDVTKVHEFEIAGIDGRFIKAEAVLKANKVIVSSANILNPVSVRYAHNPYPELPNLTDDSGLPAATFADTLLY